jgi:hypothetical protein
MQTAKLPFLSEPEHTWCYYFAKAELARQQGDWNRVIDLIDEASSLEYAPEDPFEWLTYIEAQIRMGSIEAAERRSNELFKQDKEIRKGLCEIWKRAPTQDQVTSAGATNLNEILSEFQ